MSYYKIEKVSTTVRPLGQAVPPPSGPVGSDTNPIQVVTSRSLSDSEASNIVANIVHYLDANWLSAKPHYVVGLLTPIERSPHVEAPIPKPCKRKKIRQPLLSYFPSAKWFDMPRWWRVKTMDEFVRGYVEPQAQEMSPKSDNRSTFEKRVTSRQKAKWREIRKKGYIPRTPKFNSVKPKDVKPHASDVVEMRYEPYHRGTYQLIDVTSVDIKLGLWEKTLEKLATAARKYDADHPEEVLPCPYRYLYLVLPREDDNNVVWDCVCQVVQSTGQLNAIFSERASRAFMRQTFPERFLPVDILPFESVEPHGAEKSRKKTCGKPQKTAEAAPSDEEESDRIKKHNFNNCPHCAITLKHCMAYCGKPGLECLNEQTLGVDYEKLKREQRDERVRKRADELQLQEELAKQGKAGIANIVDKNQCARVCVETEPLTEDKKQDILKEEPVMKALQEMADATAEVPEAQQEQVESWMAHAENLVIFAYQMSRADNITDMFAAVAAYAKMYVKGSIIQQLFSIINDLTTTKPEDVAPHGITDTIVDTWELIRDHMIFRKVSLLISSAMSLAVTSIKEITWSPFGLKLIHIEAAKEQVKAVDLIDACVRTFAWMVDTGWQCMKECSLAPLLYGNQRMREFTILYNYVSANLDAAMAGNLEDLGGFEKKADDALNLVINLKKVKPDGTTAEWLQKKYETLVAAKERIIAKRKNTNMKFSACGWSLNGPTAVGKSTLAKLTMLTSLIAMGFKADPDRIITLDEADKYMSTYTSDVEGVYIDDFANMVAKYAAGTGSTPCAKLIKFFNNVAAQAIKAEIQQKGCVFIDFKCGVITTNVKDLDARMFSNAPESVLRRFNHVSVRLKDKFKLPGSVSLNKQHPDIVNSKDGLLTDVWELDVEEVTAFVADEGKVKYRFDVMKINVDGVEIECKNLGLKKYLEVVVALSKRHKAEQEAVVNRAKSFDKVEYCEKCCLPKPLCSCKQCEPLKEDVKPHSLELAVDNIVQTVTDSAKKGVTDYLKSWLSPANMVNSMLGYSPIKDFTTNQLSREIQRDLNSFATPWIAALVPDWFHSTKYFQGAVECWQTSAAMCDTRLHLHRLAIASTLGYGYSYHKRSWVGGLATTLFGTGAGCVLYAGYISRKMKIREEYNARRDALPAYVKNLRDSSMPKFAIMSATLVIGVKLLHCWNKRRIEVQSLENPSDIDKSKGWFQQWLGLTGFKYEAPPAVKHTSTEQAIQTLEKNVWWCDITRANGSKTGCNIVSLQNGMVLMPDHVFFPESDMTQIPSDWIECQVTRTKKGAGGKFTFKAQRSMYSYLFSEMDLRLVYVPNLDNVKSNWRFLPLSQPTGTSMANLIVRNAGAEIQKEAVSCMMGNTFHRYRTFYGGTYLTTLAFNGACMGMLVADRKEPTILGFHVGGTTSGEGHCQTLTVQRYLEGVTTLGKMNGVVVMAQAGELPKQQLGKEVLVSDKVHPKSKFIAQLGPEAAVNVFGSTKLRTTQKSVVQKSVISSFVQEVCGVPNKWGPPQLNPNWKAFNATLEHVINPAEQFLPSELERARQDWLEPLMKVMPVYARKEAFTKLSLNESIMGIEGKRFIDGLVMKTSMGFPVYGPKEKYFDEIRDGFKLIDRIPRIEVTTEVDRLLDCWRKGLRGYPICSATLKDEPTPLGKEKVRVFQAAPVAMSLCIRMYFLPIARFLSLHPLLSESAVGVNSFSTEWKELMDHAKKYSSDKKVIAWDYSKYDVRMNSQMTSAVLKSYIDLARAGGYPKEDLDIMEMMIADIVHPMIDWNGTLLMAFNMNTSGNNITVNINSTAGSLYVRMGFFAVYPHAKDFRKCVAAMTYGDDFLGSVHPDYRNFNFESYRQFLQSHGIKITLPDKGGGTCDFMEDKDADFLKRQSNTIEGVPVPIGRLDENSIWKSLHCNLKSKSETDRNVAISCIETALHEWFAFGKDHYTKRLEQMKEVCEKANLPQTPAFCSYEERVQRWHDNYGANPQAHEVRQKTSMIKMFWDLVQFTMNFMGPDDDLADEEFDEVLRASYFDPNLYDFLRGQNPRRAQIYWDAFHNGGVTDSDSEED